MNHWSRRSFMWGSATLMLARALPVFAFDEKFGDQPFLAGVKRLIDAMAFLLESHSLPLKSKRCRKYLWRRFSPILGSSNSIPSRH